MIETPAKRGNQQRRHIYLPLPLAERLVMVEDRVNVSAAACAGIEAMVRAAEQDPTFAMSMRQDVTCDNGHTLSRPNKILIRGAWYCRPCWKNGVRYRAPDVAA